MRQRSLVRVGGVVLAASLALAACGSRDDAASSGGTASGGKVVKIGVTSPFTGNLSALGLGIQHSVELAAKQANESNAVPGWTIQVVPADDQGNPDVGKNAATQLASDDQVIGVVGNLNSSVSQQTQPIFAGAGIAQVSPANTNPSLTIGPDSANPKRQYDTYFRTCTTDAVQGPFAAQYLKGLGITKVATVNDKLTYGQGLVEAFEGEFKKDGGTITSHQTINPDESNYQAVISAIAPTNPQALYYGGQYPEAGPLSQQMKAAGLNIPLMGGDGIYDPKYIDLAGKTSEGDLATSVGAPTDSTEAGKQFLADYEKAGFADPSAAYGGYAYDAANAIINAMKVSLADASDVKGARAATVEALGKVSFEGVTGHVSFDEFGDATSKVITVYKVDNGAWVAAKTDTFK